ncbi:cytochrome P450 [Halenospora varia]|nr:cytochrome P450 [Halenospora varia]
MIVRLQELADENGEGIVVDIAQWFGFLAFDVIGDLCFGESFGCLEDAKFHPWIALIFNSLRKATIVASLKFYPLLCHLLMLAGPRSVLRKEEEHPQFAIDKVNRRLNLESQRGDFISQIKLNSDSKTGMTPAESRRSAGIIIVSGSETTTTVMSGITNYLTKNPGKYATLASEIRNVFETEGDIILTSLRELPYLNAVIQEGLRICNPIPVGLYRISLPGGDTFVSVHPLGLGLSSISFHEAKHFHPERWLATATKDRYSPLYNDDRAAVQGFSVEPRSCIGKSLAYAEVRLVLAKLVCNFDLEKVNTEAGKLQWETQRVFSVVERKPFEVKLKRRETTE